MLCRSPHGERGLKLSYLINWQHKQFCRSPHGERGLKYALADQIAARGGRSPHGERGLKLEVLKGHICQISRSPHGERGLKSIHHQGAGFLLEQSYQMHLSADTNIHL